MRRLFAVAMLTSFLASASTEYTRFYLNSKSKASIRINSIYKIEYEFFQSQNGIDWDLVDKGEKCYSTEVEGCYNWIGSRLDIAYLPENPEQTKPIIHSWSYGIGYTFNSSEISQVLNVEMTNSHDRYYEEFQNWKPVFPNLNNATSKGTLNEWSEMMFSEQDGLHVKLRTRLVRK